MLKANKAKRLAVLSILGILGLTACSSTSDEVYAKPGNYKDPIIEIAGSSEEIHNNVLSIVYDAIHEGSLSSSVLDKALYNFAESVFGVYNKVTAKGRDVEVSLKDAYLDCMVIGRTEDSQYTEANKFIKAHKSYWYYNEDGVHIDDHGTPIENDETYIPGSTERAHIVSKWLSIEGRIAEEMYSRSQGGSYTENHYFDEFKFIKSLHSTGMKVGYADAKAAGLAKIIVPSTVEEDQVFEAEVDGKKVLNRAYYQDSVSINTINGDYSAVANTFVEDEIIEKIYADLLIEQYLLDEDVASIRNSKARKINVIKISKHSSSSLNADALIKELVNEIYTAPTGDELRSDNDLVESDVKALFEKYSVVAKGVYDDVINNAETKAIADKLNDQASDVYEVAEKNGIKYYKNTSYGDLVENYDKVSWIDGYDPTDPDAKTWDDVDESLYSDYTAGGTRTVLEGFEQKKIDIAQTKSITKGWYTESKSATLDGNGTINDRLFKLSVANAKVEIGKTTDGVKQEVIDAAKAKLSETDRYVNNGTSWELRESFNEENKFLCSINGAYFLKFDGQYVGEDRRNDIVYDDGNAYYVVQVLEAVKDIKLRNNSETNYAQTRGQTFMDEVIDEIAKVLGETGNYATVSKNHWLKKMNIVYHDQEVYDYFKANYPDLFD